MYKIFSILNLFIIISTINCQVPNMIWEKSYDYNRNSDSFASVKQTSDSNFICCGNTGQDFWLVKVDKNGNTIWNKAFGPKESDLIGNDVIEFERHYYSVGSYNDDISYPGVLVLKHDLNGNFKWMKNYVYYNSGVVGSYSQATSIIKTFDSNLMVAGSCFYITSNIGTEDVWLLKINSEGDTLWTRRYDIGLNYFDKAKNIVETQDSGFVVTGVVEGPSTSATLHDLFIMKVDKYGNKLWQKIYGGTGWDHGYDLKITKDNDFIIVGKIGKNYMDYEQNSDMWLLKTDENGDTLWTKKIGTDKLEYGTAIEITEDDGFIIAGTNESHIWLVRTDKFGDTLWTRTLKGLQFSPSICKTYDNGYLIAGDYVDSAMDEKSNGYLIRFSQEKPVSIRNIDDNFIPNKIQLSQNYPNPFNPSTVISYQIPEKSFVTLKVYDILGREVATLVNEEKTAGNYNYQFSIGNYQLSNGIYFYTLKTSSFTETKKMILLR